MHFYICNRHANGSTHERRTSNQKRWLFFFSEPHYPERSSSLPPPIQTKHTEPAEDAGCLILNFKHFSTSIFHHSKSLWFVFKTYFNTQLLLFCKHKWWQKNGDKRRYKAGTRQQNREADRQILVPLGKGYLALILAQSSYAATKQLQCRET